jgi:hypothetical protein
MGKNEEEIKETRTNFVVLNILWGSIFLILFLFYIIWQCYAHFAYKYRRKNHGELVSNTAFIATLFFKMAGFFSASVLYHEYTKPEQLRFTVLTSGFPSYVSSICFLVIYVNWCSVLQEFLDRKIKNAFDKSKTILIWFIIITLSICVCLIIVICTQPDKNDIVHPIEVGFAVLRDLVLVYAFYYYLRQLSSLSGTCFPSFSSFEFSVFFLCWYFIFAIILIIVSTAIYPIVNSVGEEFSVWHFIFQIIQGLLSEIFPIILILISKVSADKKYNEESSKGTLTSNVIL